jgi:3-oxoacyl-[acyl-carrier-protein] synthase-3
MSDEVTIVLQQQGLKKSDIDLVIPHQANQRIIESLAKQLGIAMSRVVLNIGKYGNTSAATIPIALAEALEDGRVAAGSNVLLAAFGAGLTRAAGLLRWSERVTPLQQSTAELPPCDQTALEIMREAIERTRGAQGL